MAMHYEPHPEQSGVLIICYEGELVAEVSTTIFGKKPTFPKGVSSLNDAKEAIQQLELKGAKRYVLNKLSQRSYHSVEIKNLLLKKKVSEDTIERIISDCTRYGYINDREWIDHYVRRERDKKRGPQWIEGKLRQKGISQEEIQQAIEETEDEEELREQIFRLIRTRYRTRNLLDYREREKTIGALVRRGFEVNMVREVIRTCSQSH